MKKRIVQSCKLICLLAVLVGLAVAPMSASSYEGASGGSLPTKTLPLGRITGDCLGQTVIVSGRIVNIIKPTSERAPYSIYLTDGEDTLRVVVWPDTYDHIPSQEQIKPGSEIIVTGTVKEFRHDLNLNVNNPEDLILKGAETAPSGEKDVIAVIPVGLVSAPVGVLTPQEIGHSRLKSAVTVIGAVRNFKPSWNEQAPNSIYLQGAGRVLRVVYWGEVARKLGAPWIPKLGQILLVKGTVEEYKGDLQLKVQAAGDIKEISAIQDKAPASSEKKMARTRKTSAGIVPGEPGSEENPILLKAGQVTFGYIGKYVQVQGDVLDFTASWESSAPNKVRISDGERSVIIVYWPDVAEAIPTSHKPEVGKAIVVKGKVDEYRGDIQLKVYNPEYITTLTETPDLSKVNVPEPKKLTIQEVNRDLLNQKVIISGTVTGVVSVGGGRLLKITDDTGTITVPLWDSVACDMDYLELIQKGARITLSGLVDVYKPRNEIQIKLVKGEDIVLLK